MIENGRQKLTITDRKRLEADGVKNVICFDEEYVEVETDLGVLCIAGEGMRVEALNNDNGRIHITGVISEVGYKEKKAKKKMFAK